MMKASNKINKLIIFSVIAVQIFTVGFSGIPVTGLIYSQNDVMNDPVESNPDSSDSPVDTSTNDKVAALKQFVDSVIDGESGTIRGLYTEDVFGYPVIQQPSSKPAFVSEINDVVTEFAMASQYGTTGMLAHNYLAGTAFFSLEVEDFIQVVYGDGSIKEYKVVDVLSFQALSPDSASSSFLNLETGETLTSTQLFKQVYTGSHHLTLQTCIEKGSEDSWGRLFVIAEPVI